jgi:hypothetical protein
MTYDEYERMRSQSMPSWQVFAHATILSLRVKRRAWGGGGEGGDDSMRELFLHEREVTGQNTHCVKSRCGGRPVIQCLDSGHSSLEST